MLGAYKAGQSNNAVLKGLAPAIGAVSGLVGFGALASMFPMLLAAGPWGWAAAAGIGAVVGLIGIFKKSADQKVREKVKQVYGVDVTEKNIRDQIVDLAKSKYGGNLDVAVRSPEVMELVRLYSMATGKSNSLPRPMYPVTFQQSSAGLQLQPTYQGGTLVSSPYTGPTTSQWAQTATYIQLDPRQANNLLEGQVVQIIGNNPETVGRANENAVRSGTNRAAQQGALLEPMTLMRS